MKQNKALTDFKNYCQKYFICYSLASTGLEKYANTLQNQDRSTTLTMHVAEDTEPPGDNNRYGSMNLGELYDSSQRSGNFSDQIAKSFICAIYSLWEEYYRHEIALENHCKKRNVMSDLMGDIRLIRNCIIHKKSQIINEDNRIIELKWELSPGTLKVTEEMFQISIRQINEMTILIQD